MSTPTSSPRTPSPEERSPQAQLSAKLTDEQAQVGTVPVGVVPTPLPGSGPVASTTTKPSRSTFLGDLWRIITSNRKMAIGLIVIAFFILVAIFGPILITRDPNALSADSLQPPSARHLLGTTQLGQDVFTQLVIGTRVSIFWGFLTSIVVTIISVVVGLVSGSVGGVVDDILSMLTNVFLVLPGFPLAIVLAAFLPFKGPLTIAIAVTVTGWAWGARVLRAQTLSLRQRDFVEAARASGESMFRIIFFEILPNELAVVVANFVGTAIYIILADVGLEYLGVGNPNIPSWGTMFFWAGNNDALLLGAWWWFVPPGLCIAILGASLALINFGIDEVANPRLRRERLPRMLRNLKRPGKTNAPEESVVALTEGRG